MGKVQEVSQYLEQGISAQKYKSKRRNQNLKIMSRKNKSTQLALDQSTIACVGIHQCFINENVIPVCHASLPLIQFFLASSSNFVSRVSFSPILISKPLGTGRYQPGSAMPSGR